MTTRQAAAWLFFVLMVVLMIPFLIAGVFARLMMIPVSSLCFGWQWCNGVLEEEYKGNWLARMQGGD